LTVVLDTSVAIMLRDDDVQVAAWVETLGDMVLSIVTRIELEGGVYARPEDFNARRARLDLLLEQFQVLEFDSSAADAYRGIVAASGYSRRKTLDRMIAAQALTIRAPLATLNPSDFQDIPGLAILTR
jgi:predicted nucleic acid-binding protein